MYISVVCLLFLRGLPLYLGHEGEMIHPTVQSLLCAEFQMGLQGCLAASRRDPAMA